MDVALYDQGEYALYRQAKAEGVTFDCQAPLLRRLSALLVIHQQEIGLEFLRAEKHIALARAEVAQCHRRRRLRRQERQPDGRGGLQSRTAGGVWGCCSSVRITWGTMISPKRTDSISTCPMRIR